MINKKKLRSIASTAWAFIVILLSLTPTNKFSTINWIDIYHIDKLAHFGFYFVWITLYCAYRKNLKVAIKTFIMLLIVGLVLECLQGNFIPGRTFSFLDILLNILGLLMGYLLVRHLWYNYFRKTSLPDDSEPS